MATTIDGIVTWLKNWFYDKSEVNTYLNAKANKNLTNANMNVVTDASGDITTEAKPTIPDVSGKIDTAGTGLSKSGTTLNHSNSITAVTTASFKKYKYDAQGHITGTANVGASDLPFHTHDGDDVAYDSQNSVNDEIDIIYTSLNGKASASHTHGNLQNDGSVGTSGNASKNVVTDANGKITTENKPDLSGYITTAGTGLSKSGQTLNHSNSVTALSTAGLRKIQFDSEGHITGVSSVTSADLPSHQHSTQAVNHDIALQNLNISPNSSQSQINNAIDSAIGNLSSINAIQIVSTLPEASSSTMGKLYIISENNKVNVYYTEQNGSSYSWHKMDADILDELSIAWTDITGRPTKTSDFTNDGADGTNVFVADNDSRLSNARTPTSHTHGQLTNDGKITSTAVTVASGDNILITDASDSSKVKRVANLLAGHIKDGTAHSNIGSSANDTQATINSDIDTALSNKANSVHTHNNYVTSIALVPKATDNTGAIKLYYGDEPT